MGFIGPRARRAGERGRSAAEGDSMGVGSVLQSRAFELAHCKPRVSITAVSIADPSVIAHHPFLVDGDTNL